MVEPVGKPLNCKAYGSIPHLPGSNFGNDKDYNVSPDAAVMFLSKRKEKDDEVFVTEKLDGSNTGITKVDNEIIPLVRRGHRADSSPYFQHRVFARWVYERWETFDKLLDNRERVVGEWLMQAHGTIYELDGREPWAAFDIFTPNNERIPFDTMVDRCTRAGLSIAPLLHRGGPIGIERVMTLLGKHGLYGAVDEPEGAVWRIERGGEFMSIAKYVRRPGCEIGRYLPEKAGKQIWNWRGYL